MKTILFIILCNSFYFSYADFGIGYYYIKGTAVYNNLPIKNKEISVTNQFYNDIIKTDNNGNFTLKIQINYPCFGISKPTLLLEQKLSKGLNDSILILEYDDKKLIIKNYWEKYYYGKFINKKHDIDTEYLNLIFYDENTKVEKDDNSFKILYQNIYNNKSKEDYLYNNIKELNFIGLSKIELDKLFQNNHIIKYLVINKNNISVIIPKINSKKREELHINIRLINDIIVKYDIHYSYVEFIKGKNGGGMNLSNYDLILKKEK